MVNQNNNSILTLLQNRAVSVDKKLNGAYYALQLSQTEEDRAFYREMALRSLDAWTTYWRVYERLDAVMCNNHVKEMQEHRLKVLSGVA